MMASEMTDAELDEAVARECGFANPTTDGMDFTPTTDARDAERVWDWLSRNLPKNCRMRLTGYDDNSGGFCLEVYDDARKIWGSPFPELDADWAHPGEAVAMYKRALCEAALAVARRVKG